MSLGNKLYELRKSKNLSQEDLAEKLNVTRQTVSKWETDQSTPDFDKIMPLCNLFEITADELINGEKREKDEEKQVDNGDNKLEEQRRKQKLGLGIGVGVSGYFLAIAWIMIAIPVLMINPIVASGMFLLICGVSTGIIVYTGITCKKEKKRKEIVEDRKIKSIEKVLNLTTLVIYLLVSFITMAWHITWIIWIVDVLVLEIIKLMFSFKEDGDNE